MTHDLFINLLDKENIIQIRKIHKIENDAYSSGYITTKMMKSNL